MTGIIRGSGDKRRFFLDGLEVSEEAFDKAFPPVEDGPGIPGSSLISFKPVVSEALAVHPKQVNFAREDAKRKGVPVEFQDNGQPIFRSSRQFRNYARAYGFFHKGY